MANPLGEATASPPERALTPPYVAYGQFKSLLRRLQRDSVPARLDYSIINNLSASTQIQTLLAFRFLRLIDPHGRPADALTDLVSATDGDLWPERLRCIWQHAYAPVFRLALNTATPQELAEEFIRNFSGTNNVLRKSRTFFLHGAREARIELSPYLLATIKMRDAPNRGVRRRSRPPQVGTTPLPQAAGRPSSASVVPKQSDLAPLLSERLVSELDIREMTEVQQRAFWTILKFLKELGR